jgi:hypothetical protein
MKTSIIDKLTTSISSNEKGIQEASHDNAAEIDG